MEYIDPRVMSLYTILGENIRMTPEIQNIIMKGLIKAHFITENKSEPTQKCGHKTGYHVFVQQRNSELKKVDEHGHFQEQIIAEWKELPEDQKARYKEQATQLNSAEKKPKKMSGYNYYVKSNSHLYKGHLDMLKLLGASWKALSKEEQAEWNARANDPQPIMS